jgi:LPPG:FO 2-phospho-L-lactate transferase
MASPAEDPVRSGGFPDRFRPLVGGPPGGLPPPADRISVMRITALAGGIGGARFLRGLLTHLAGRPAPDAEITVIGNTADDVTLHGLRVCPDLDTVMYTLGGGIHAEQGWGRSDERFTVAEELAAYGSQPQWFTLGDRDLATHLARTRLLGQGHPLSAVTAILCERWQPGVRLLPMTDDRVETHVTIDDPSAEGGLRAVHFQEWWVRLHAAVPARQILAVGIEQATPAPGVLEAIAEADVVLLPPSNPVVSIGTVLGVPGIRDALRATAAPVVGVSPIIAGAPVRGMADACLTAIGVPTTAAAVAGLYADFLDGWLVAEQDAGDWPDASPGGGSGPDGSPDGERPVVVGRPLLMSDPQAAADLAGAALDLALELRQRSRV